MAGKKDDEGLTPKQRKFVQGLASGLSLADAYRQAYDATGMADRSIRVESAKLSQHPIVAQALMRIREQRERQNQILTVSDRDMVLKNLRQWTRGDGEPPTSAQLRAAELLGKACGLYKDVVETRTERPAADILGDIERRLNAMQASAPVETVPDCVNGPDDGEQASGSDAGDGVRVH